MRVTTLNLATATGTLSLARLQAGNYPTQVNPANPSGTTSTTAVMMGLGAAASPTTFKPTKTGTILMIFTFAQTNSVTGDSSVSLMRYGTGSPPANGDAATGTQGWTQNITVAAPVGGTPDYVTVAVWLTGLTLNTTYWFDIALNSQTALTTSTITNVIMTVAELSK